MRSSSSQVQEDRAGSSDFGQNCSNFNRKARFEITRPSPFMTATTSTAFPPLLPDKRSYWKRFSFGKSSSQPIRLSILKLDGSTFDIIVPKKATVAKLKQAVEAAFSYVPTQGDCSISWPHVWGHFCLCFEHMKLLRDRDPIARHGIKNGDQLQFVRNTPIYTIAGETSKKLTYDTGESNGSSSKPDLCRELKSKKNPVKTEVREGYKMFGASKKHRSSFGCLKRNNRVVNATVRLGRPWLLSGDDADGNETGDESFQLDAYPPNTFSDYVGGFGYPTGYCLK